MSHNRQMSAQIAARAIDLYCGSCLSINEVCDRLGRSYAFIWKALADADVVRTAAFRAGVTAGSVWGEVSPRLSAGSSHRCIAEDLGINQASLSRNIQRARAFDLPWLAEATHMHREGRPWTAIKMRLGLDVDDLRAIVSWHAGFIRGEMADAGTAAAHESCGCTSEPHECASGQDQDGVNLRAENAGLRAALVRLCWNLVADDADCTCDCDDDSGCPPCEAFRALGFGRWPGAEKAAGMLTEGQC